MAVSAGTSAVKKLIRIDVCSDTVCPWCFVGKKYLDKAIAASKDKYDFEISWHPYQLRPDAPKKGVDKRDYLRRTFGAQSELWEVQMTEVFRGLDLNYNLSGLTGSTLDSHRLIYFAGKQGLDKQHNLVEELNIGYFTEAKFIGDRKFLLECADKVGVIGAGEFLANPNNGVDQVNEEFQKFCSGVSGVPFFVINGKKKLSGAQSPEVMLKAFQAAAN